MRWWFGGAIVAGAMFWWSVAPSSADLADYVRKPDAEFAWRSVNHTSNETGTVFTLHLTSQKWQDIVWEHAVQVYLAKNVPPKPTMLIWVTGGKPNPVAIIAGLEISRLAQVPVAFLYDIPNQPLLGNKREDALIAETFVRYLQSGDENWPLLFPMVKSVVRAMDALQAFARQEWKTEVRHFVVSGASKRGWTTWLTASLQDPRVVAIAPMVIDVLNMPEQLAWQVKSLGGYSTMLRDYIDAGLIPMPQTERAKKLWSMVDPYVYRQKFTVPKLIVLGSNDPYWASDALNLYWDGLPGEKWVLYVPNAGHDLRDRKALDPTAQLRRSVYTLSAFVRRQANGQPMPKFTWKHTADASTATLEITWEITATDAAGRTAAVPVAARLWVADAPTRDFRTATWTSRDLPLPANQHRLTSQVDVPKTGCRALFGELEFRDGDQPFWLSTQMQIVGTPTPAKP
jgi:PhoPQ-activated pathogenicity-related protein